MLCPQFPRIPEFFSLLCILIILQRTQRMAAGYEFIWNDCQGDANYTANSTYQSNLNHLLSSLSTAAVATGYYNDTVGKGGNQVYGLAQCRGDQSDDDCRSCLSTATQSIVQKCPKGQNSVIYYEECFLRYANESFFSPTNTSGRGHIYWCDSGSNASNPQAFDNLLHNMMDALSRRVSNSPKKYAGDVASYTSFSSLYGWMQCTRDLSQSTCHGCLEDLRQRLKQLCSPIEGGRIFGFSCYARYEIYPFYNISADASSPPPPLSLPPSTTNGTGSPQGSTTTGGKRSNNSVNVLAIVIPVAALVVLLPVALFLYKRRTKSTGQGRVKDPKFNSKEYISFKFATLRSATDNFADANKLGEGGFGPVYKGTLGNGDQIAVKKLSINSGQGLVEFETETVLVAKLQHKNLVRLLGCCFERQEKMLVYEYLPNKSLDNFLFDSSRRVELNWGRRRKIIEGIARGLLYLHEDSRLKIIHRDLKASNILLDVDMNSKISDFGLAKLVNINETHRNTSKIAGTFGYMAPEYAMHGIFSVKSDVFSYGVLVLEIVTGQRNSGSDGNSTNLLSYVWQHWNEGRALEVVDQSMADDLKAEEVIKCIHIGLLCVQEDAADRPDMTSVVLMLSRFSVNLPNPYAPAFFFHSRSNYDSDSLDLSDAQGKANNSKVNTVISQEISEDLVA